MSIHDDQARRVRVKLAYLAAHLACLAGVAACGSPSLKTPADRLDNFDAEIHRNVRQSTSCEDGALTYRSSEQRNAVFYDLYGFRGCGQELSFIAAFAKNEVDDRWSIAYTLHFALEEEQFRAAAVDQLRKV